MLRTPCPASKDGCLLCSPPLESNKMSSPQLNPVPAELVTAATNLPLAVVSLVAVVCLWQLRQAQALRAGLWLGMFGSLAVASGLGIFAHGLALDPTTRKLIWHPIHAALALTVASFVAGAVLDRWGAGGAGRALLVLLGLSAAFFGYATFWSNSFLPFVLYEGTAMLFCITVYVFLAVQHRLAGAGWMVAGVGITILAAGLQAMPAMQLRLGVTFDHNGVFHLVQLAGLLCLLTGVQPGFDPPPETGSTAAPPGQNRRTEAAMPSSRQDRV